jgi:hypothetical protein
MLYQNIAGQSLLGRDQWRWRVDRVDGEIVWMVELVSLETTIPLGLLHTASSKEIWSRGMMPPMPKWYHCPSPVGDIGNLKFEGGVARRHCNHRIGIYMPGEWVRRKEGEGRGREGERERGRGSTLRTVRWMTEEEVAEKIALRTPIRQAGSPRGRRYLCGGNYIYISMKP